jgi:putative tryptophan/tyrosine transport system substrate-binding protein
MKRLAVLWDERVDDAQLRAARATAQLAGISLVTLGARTVQDLDGVIPRAMRARSQALLVLTGPMFTPNRAKLVESAMRHHLPMASVFPILAEAGGVLGYGPDLSDLYRQAAKFVDRVLKGARPADLPVERPSKFLLVINLKTAKALGLTIPPSLLAQADRVIE